MVRMYQSACEVFSHTSSAELYHSEDGAVVKQTDAPHSNWPGAVVITLPHQLDVRPEEPGTVVRKHPMAKLMLSESLHKGGDCNEEHIQKSKT